MWEIDVNLVNGSKTSICCGYGSNMKLYLYLPKLPICQMKKR